VITALLEVGLSPVTWPGTASRMPISVLIAVVANFGLVYFTKYVTGSVGSPSCGPSAGSRCC